MQHPFSEILVTHKQADIEREIDQIKLIREAEQANAPFPGWAANKMHDLSVWMILTGERLHERYHAPNHLHHLHQRSTQTR